MLLQVMLLLMKGLVMRRQGRWVTLVKLQQLVVMRVRMGVGLMRGRAWRLVRLVRLVRWRWLRRERLQRDVVGLERISGVVQRVLLNAPCKYKEYSLKM